MSEPMPAAAKNPIRVGLFATCLVDLIRPGIGFAAAKLLEDAGCDVEVPQQTCCGQPAFNSGDRNTARELAAQAIETFERYDYVVLPSGSCAGQVIVHYPELFAGDAAWEPRAEGCVRENLRAHRFSERRPESRRRARVSTARSRITIPVRACANSASRRSRASCSGMSQGLRLVEMKDPDVCCGFGGTFCVKYPDVSNKIVEKKTANIAASGAATLLAGDLGCLMNMAGKLSREGKAIKVRHIAEVLAGMSDEPAIGERGR